MRLTAFFLLLCTLVCFFFLKDNSFLSEDYIQDSVTVGYNYYKNEPVSYHLLSYPLDSYLEDNSQSVSSLSDDIADSIYNLEDFSSDLFYTGKGFFDKIIDIDVDLVSSDPLSAAYLYRNNPSYKSFVRSYLKILQSSYRKADFNFIQKYLVPRFIDFVPNVEKVLQTNVRYSSADLNITGNLFGGNYFICDPYYYFIAFSINPQYHISIQDNFSRFGINSLYIDTSFLIQGKYRIFVRSFRRSLDSNGNLVIEILSEDLTNYVYDPVSNSVLERG